ncbi:hypothetical protein BGX28_009998 [Mortierella sp. GBA30]|nr:hypothetical protein BGX28_009998 [Mortierella sp. GBA30]
MKLESPLYNNNKHFEGSSTGRWSDCPIRVHTDTCVHYAANFSTVEKLCGSAFTTNHTISFGRCQDRTYDMILTTTGFMEESSKNTNTMVVLGFGIGAVLDDFVQTRSRWVIDLMGGEGYEVLLSTADTEGLALHKELDDLQRRCERFFNGGINPFGFGSYWHTLVLALAHSLYHDMTLFPPGKLKNFIPITTCTEKDMEISFAAHPPETDFRKWITSTVNYKSEGADVWDLMRKDHNIKPEYKHKGLFWLRSMLTYYVIRPNSKLREKIRRSSKAVTPCMSIHVRHSDKHLEATQIGLADYMERASQYKEKTGISQIYIMTDDDAVIQSTKSYTDFQFQYQDIARSNKGWLVDKNEGLSIDKQEEIFLLDLYSATRCQHNILTYSSNVGRLTGEVSYALRKKEPDAVSLDRNWYTEP